MNQPFVSMTGRAAVMLAAMLVSAAPFDAGAQGGPPAAAVGVDAVATVPADQTVPVIGRFVTRQSGTVAARVSGAVDDVTVQVGDRVSAGDLLVRQDAARFALIVEQREAAVDFAQTAVKTARATVRLYETQLGRLEKLRGSAAFSGARSEDAGAELARAQSQLSEAVARVAQARADLDLARLDLAYTEIRAPFDGVVTARMAQPGAFLNAGGPVVTLLDDGALEIEADVSSNRIAGLVPGAPIAATVADRTFDVMIRAIIPNENPLTRTRAVRFSLAEGRADFAENQSVTVDIPVSGQSTALTVHKDAVIQGARGAMVFVVRDGKAMPQPVELGAAVGGRLEVLNGLSEGDVVVVRGNERLRPGQNVRYQDGEATGG